MPKATSVGGWSKRRQASKGGPEGGSKGGRSKVGRNFEPKNGRVLSSCQIQIPIEPANLNHSDCEIRTNAALGSENKQIDPVAESMAALELVKKPPSSSPKEEESDTSLTPEQRSLHAIMLKEWRRLGKDRELENYMEERKNFCCDLCSEKGHTEFTCPFRDWIPKHVRTVPSAYSIMCNLCHHIIEQSCHHEDDARRAIKKHCVRCGKWGDHWVAECREETPWWELERQEDEINKA